MMRQWLSTEYKQEPPRQLHRKIAKRLAGLKKELAKEELKDNNAEAYLTVCLFDSEVRNGGFSQYFTNCHGDSYQRVIDFFEKIGATDHVAVIKAFLSSIPEGVDPGDASQMGHYLFQGEAQLSEATKFDKQYWGLKSAFYDSMTRFALENGLDKY